MDITRSCKISDLNWGALPDLMARLKRLGITVESISAELSWYPDKVTFDSLEDASRDAIERGSPKHFDINIRGKRDEKLFSLSIYRSRNIHSQEFLCVRASGIEGSDQLDSITEFLGLIPDEPSALPPRPPRTAFITHRFDSTGTDCSDKLARFLELLGFRVVTGRAYAPKSISSKVRARIEEQAVIFVILTPGSDDTWLTQESILGEVKGKPLIILKEKSVEFKPGILADHEYIPFQLSNIEGGFISVLEGLRDLGYLEFA